jgi:glucans biosynthesis protein C
MPVLSESHSGASRSPRRLDIDNLRNLAVFALILFHSARLFNNEAWHIKDASTYVWADWIIRIINEPHMPLFFLLAGVSTVFALRNRSMGAFAGERVLRLLIPLVLGSILLVSPQVYIERISPFSPMRYGQTNFDGSYFDFLPTFFNGVYPSGNFSWHHLWFLAYLFIYSIVFMVPVVLLMRNGGLEAIGRWLSRKYLYLILPTFVIWAAFVALHQAFPVNHGVVGDWWAHVHYGFVFLMGCVIAGSPALTAAVRDNRRVALVISAICVTIWLAGRLKLMPVPSGEIVDLRDAGYHCGEWFLMMTLVGYAHAGLNRWVPGLSAFTRYAMPFYVFHQTIIVALGYALFDWQDQPVLKYLLVCAASGVFSLVACLLADSNPVTRLIVGMKAARRPLARSTQPATA